MKYSTLAVHGGLDDEERHGSVTYPVYFTTTYTQPDTEHFQPYAYSRSKNPTRSSLEELVQKLEGARHALAVSTGMAAISLVFELLKPGDTLLFSPNLYGGVWRFAENLLVKRGVKLQLVASLNDVDFDQLDPSVKMVYLETPSNPLMEITDIERIAREAKKHGILSVADNTFMTSFLQRPLDLGIDVVVYSATKYYGGHSDVLAGLLVTNNDELFEQFSLFNKALGAPLSPMDAFLLTRGIRTLPLRLERHSQNAQKIAEFLEKHDAVSKIYYPGLPSHPGYDLHRRQAKAGGGTLSFELNESRYDYNRFVTSLTLYSFAVSLGGVESLICRPSTMTHEALSPEMQRSLGIYPTLIRISVGIEDAQDLMDDLAQAFEKARR